MKKLLLLPFLALSFSVYPIIVQTVVLKNKETGQQVVLYGDQSSFYGEQSVDEQLRCLNEKIASIPAVDLNKFLFLIKDVSTDIVSKISNNSLDSSELLYKLRYRLNAYGIQPTNIDIWQVCMPLITYITSQEFAEQSIKMSPELEGKSALEIIRSKPEDARKFDMLLQNLPLGIDNLSDAYSMLYEIIKVITEQLKYEYADITQLSEQEKNELFNTFDTVIENVFQLKSIISLAYVYQDSAGLLEMKTALEILKNTDKKVIVFLPIAIIPKLINVIKTAYDVEFNSKIQLNDSGDITEYDFADLDLILSIAMRMTMNTEESDLNLTAIEFHEAIISRSKCQVNSISENHFDYITQ